GSGGAEDRGPRPGAPGQHGAGKVDIDQSGPGQVCLGEVGARQVHAGQPGASQPGAHEVSPRQADLLQPGAGQVGAGQVCSGQVEPGEPLAGRVSVAQHCTAQPRAAVTGQREGGEVLVTQVLAAEVERGSGPGAVASGCGSHDGHGVAAAMQPGADP